MDKLYRFSPIKNTRELLTAIKHIHSETHKLCMQAFNYYLPNTGNIGVFCHYDDEYEHLIAVQKGLTKESDNLNQKYFRLLEPIVIPKTGDVPESTYTYLFIRKPDPYRHHVGDIDMYLNLQKYKEIKSLLLAGKKRKGVRVFERAPFGKWRNRRVRRSQRRRPMRAPQRENSSPPRAAD